MTIDDALDILEDTASSWLNEVFTWIIPATPDEEEEASLLAECDNITEAMRVVREYRKDTGL